MSQLIVTLPLELADAVARRAAHYGQAPEEVVITAIRRYLEPDPFEYFGIASSDVIKGADVDRLLEEFGFGQ